MTTDHDRDDDADTWVTPARAAELTGASERWLVDRCYDGRLPSRPSLTHPWLEFVPLSTARALVDREITD